MRYSKRVWLNKDSSPSTGSMAAYRGPVPYKEETPLAAFLEIADCQNKVRIHITPMDTMEEFIVKMETMRNFIDDFINYLDEEQSEIAFIKKNRRI
jgi:hypothetical protein